MADNFPAAAPRPADADPASYRPVSGFAVAALMVSAATAVAVVGVVIASRVARRPMLSWWIVLAALVGFVLAVVARRHVLRSEGTRVGIGLANAAWWLSLLVGAGYGAYLAATDLAVAKQAQAVGQEFIDLLLAGQPEKAFFLTREPAQQRAMKQDDVEGIRRRFGAGELATLNRSELARLVRAWPGQVKVEYLGARENEQTVTGFKVPLIYLIRSPEGQVEMTLLTQAYDDTQAGSRGWTIVLAQSGANQRSYQRTKLGRLLTELQSEAIRLMPDDWRKFAQAGPEAIEPLLRVEGDPPPAAQKAALARDLSNPAAVTFFSRDPLKTVFPTAAVRDGTIEIFFSAYSNTPTLGDGVQTFLTARVTGDELTADARKLSGSGWEQEPVIPPSDETPALSKYQWKMVPALLNLRPLLPRDAPPQEGPPGRQ